MIYIPQKICKWIDKKKKLENEPSEDIFRKLFSSDFMKEDCFDNYDLTIQFMGLVLLQRYFELSEKYFSLG